MDWEVLVFVNIEALGQTAETHSLVFGDSTSAPSPEPVHCAPPRSVVQQPVVERLQLHLTTSRRRHNSKFQARETALVFPRAAYRAQALPHMLLPCCELSRTSSKEDLPALCMAPHPADPDLGSTIDSFDASWQMGMSRANQESDHRSLVQHLHCRAESLSNQNAELEKALNTAKSDVVLQEEKFMELAQHIVACAPEGRPASSATLQAKETVTHWHASDCKQKEQLQIAKRLNNELQQQLEKATASGVAMQQDFNTAYVKLQQELEQANSSKAEELQKANAAYLELQQQLEQANGSKTKQVQKATNIINGLHLDLTKVGNRLVEAEEYVDSLQSKVQKAEESRQEKHAQLDLLTAKLAQQQELPEKFLLRAEATAIGKVLPEVQAEAGEGSRGWPSLGFGSNKNKRVQQQQTQKDLQQQNGHLQQQQKQLLQDIQHLQRELQQQAEQYQSLQRENSSLTDQHKLAEQRAVDVQQSAQQQIAMLQEQAASQQAHAVNRTFNYLTDSETTADGYPLSGLATALKQDLHKSIIHLFKVIQELGPMPMAVLLESTSSLWQAIHVQSQQESRSFRRTRLLRDGFVHAVLLELDKLCWCQDSDAAEAFCFRQKKQISYRIGQETQAGSLSLQDTAAHRNIAAALDLYTKNCQYWLSESTKTPSVLGTLAEQYACKLLNGLWPGEPIEGTSSEVAAGLCAVTHSAICMRLHAESCHPCLLLSVKDYVSGSEICASPAVVVDPCMSLVAPDSNVRIAAEVDSLSGS